MSVNLNRQLQDRLQTIFTKNGSLKNVFLFDQAPAKKLRNATRSYAKAMGNEETVILLYDDTVFGSSKEGFILTTRRFYGKNLMESPAFAEVAAITAVTYDPASLGSPEAHIHTGSGPVLKKHLIMSHSEGQSQILCAALGEAVALLQNPNARPGIVPGQQVVSARCAGCGAVGQMGVCEYCDSSIG